jgi:hypothetical protein
MNRDVVAGPNHHFLDDDLRQPRSGAIDSN